LAANRTLSADIHNLKERPGKFWFAMPFAHIASHDLNSQSTAFGGIEIALNELCDQRIYLLRPVLLNPMVGSPTKRKSALCVHAGVFIVATARAVSYGPRRSCQR
jgi:hypothetical protein